MEFYNGVKKEFAEKTVHARSSVIAKLALEELESHYKYQK